MLKSIGNKTLEIFKSIHLKFINKQAHNTQNLLSDY